MAQFENIQAVLSYHAYSEIIIYPYSASPHKKLYVKGSIALEEIFRQKIVKGPDDWNMDHRN